MARTQQNKVTCSHSLSSAFILLTIEFPHEVNFFVACLFFLTLKFKRIQRYHIFIHRIPSTRINQKFNSIWTAYFLHAGELQHTIRTEDGFFELVDPRGIVILCPVQCSTCVAPGIRALCFKEATFGYEFQFNLILFWACLRIIWYIYSVV